MGTTVLYYGMAIFLILTLYAICKIVFSDTEYVLCVEAGPMDGMNAELLKRKSYKTSRKPLYSPDGELLSSEYFRVLVNGNCMKPRKISHDNEVIARRFTPNLNIRERDVVMIYIEDSGMYKLREVRKVEGEILYTIRYDADGNEIPSSKPHHINQVKDIVKYKID